jgi:hydrogenase assembly chaperone HypC/HupF
MCLVAPGQVITIDGSAASVAMNGRIRSVSIALEPDVAVGDWVVIAGSVVIRRVEPTTAQDMQAAVRVAYRQPAPNPPSQERSPA